MAIRVEFYASDQVAASSIVEFALSLGAVLQSYSEVAPPLKRGPNKSKRKVKHGGAHKRRVNGTTFLKCVTTENPFREGGARHLACDVIMKHRVPILYSSLVQEIDAAVEILDSNIRKVIALMLDNGQLVITHK
jgi:hypothetical protein